MCLFCCLHVYEGTSSMVPQLARTSCVHTAKRLCAHPGVTYHKTAHTASFVHTHHVAPTDCLLPCASPPLPTGKGRGWLVDAVAKSYPGRAAMTPLLDLLTTLLYWGASGWRGKLQQREELYVYLR